MTRTATNPTLEWRGVEPSREVSLKRVVLLPFVTLRFDLRGFFFFFSYDTSVQANQSGL